jgi:chromosome partitioning protein
MGKIITVAHQKGGVGKSTLAMNLAVCFQDQLSVALVDTDWQGSLLQIKEDLPGLAMVGNDQLQEIKNLDYDLIIVDTPPYLSNKLSELFSLSDFILIPTKAGFFDIMAIRSTIALVNDAQVKNPDIKAGIVMNMIKPRSGITKEVTGLLEGMATPVLKTLIHDRVSIARSSITAGVLQGSDAKAKSEITSLAEEIVNRIST